MAPINQFCLGYHPTDPLQACADYLPCITTTTTIAGPCEEVIPDVCVYYSGPTDCHLRTDQSLQSVIFTLFGALEPQCTTTTSTTTTTTTIIPTTTTTTCVCPTTTSTSTTTTTTLGPCDCVTVAISNPTSSTLKYTYLNCNRVLFSNINLAPGKTIQICICDNSLVKDAGLVASVVKDGCTPVNTTTTSTTTTTTMPPTTTTTTCPCNEYIFNGAKLNPAQFTIVRCGDVFPFSFYGTDYPLYYCVNNAFPIIQTGANGSYSKLNCCFGTTTTTSTSTTSTTSTTTSTTSTSTTTTSTTSTTTTTTAEPTTTTTSTTICPDDCFDGIFINITTPGLVGWTNCFGVYTSVTFTSTGLVQIGGSGECVQLSSLGGTAVYTVEYYGGNCCITTTSTTSTTSTTTTTICPDCYDGFILNVSSGGTVSWTDCNGNSKSLLVGTGLVSVTDHPYCINVATLGGTAVYSIYAYGNLCCPSPTTTTSTSTTSTSSTTTTTTASLECTCWSIENLGSPLPVAPIGYDCNLNPLPAIPGGETVYVCSAGVPGVPPGVAMTIINFGDCSNCPTTTSTTTTTAEPVCVCYEITNNDSENAEVSWINCNGDPGGDFVAAGFTLYKCAQFGTVTAVNPNVVITGGTVPCSTDIDCQPL